MNRLKNEVEYIDVSIFDELLVSADDKNVLLIVVVAFISRVSPASVSEKIGSFLILPKRKSNQIWQK
jgi:hypothetical protein